MHTKKAAHSIMSAKLRYGGMLAGIIVTLHIGHTLLKPFLLPDNTIEKRQLSEKYLEELKKI